MGNFQSIQYNLSKKYKGVGKDLFVADFSDINKVKDSDKKNIKDNFNPVMPNFIDLIGGIGKDLRTINSDNIFFSSEKNVLRLVLNVEEDTKMVLGRNYWFKKVKYQNNDGEIKSVTNHYSEKKVKTFISDTLTPGSDKDVNFIVDDGYERNIYFKLLFDPEEVLKEYPYSGIGWYIGYMGETGLMVSQTIGKEMDLMEFFSATNKKNIFKGSSYLERMLDELNEAGNFEIYIIGGKSKKASGSNTSFYPTECLPIEVTITESKRNDIEIPILKGKNIVEFEINDNTVFDPDVISWLITRKNKDGLEEPINDYYTEIYLPGNTKNIKTISLESFDNLEILDLNKVEKIGQDSLSYLPKLKEITIPDTLEYIGSGFLSNCTSLINKNFNFGPNLKYFGTFDNYYCNCNNNSFEGCKNIEEITFSEGFKVIGSRSFYKNDKKIRLVIPESIELITGVNYLDCYELSCPLMDESKQFLIKGDKILYCVHDYKEGEKLIIPENIKIIGAGAFSFGNYKADLEIPRNVEMIEPSAFFDFIHTWSSGTIKFNEGLKILGDSAFSECGINDLRLPKSIQEIGENCFYNAEVDDVYIICDKVPKGGKGMFDFNQYDPYKQHKIYVPKGMLKEYQNTEFWSDYADLMIEA